MRRLFLLTLCFALLSVPAFSATMGFFQNADGSVTLVWDPNTESDLAGYKVYWGNESGNYTNVPYPTTTQPTYTTPILPEGTYFFAVTAYDTNGNESGFSNEVSCEIRIPPVPPTGLRILEESASLQIIDRKTAEIVWTTNIPASTELVYNREGFSSREVIDETLRINHSVGIGLQPNKLWYYTIVSRVDDQMAERSGSFDSYR